jgi:spore maturation protein CgeB
MNIVAVYHDFNWEDGALRPALEKFGQVRVIDWARWYDPRVRDRSGDSRKRMNDSLLAEIGKLATGETIHVIFCYVSGEIVRPETLQALSSLRIPMVNLALNDKEAFVGRIRGGDASGARDICRHFDVCWTSTRDALEKYCVEGARPLYLPEGANPEIHRPYEEGKTFDVSFVGQCYGNRPLVIESLRDAAIRVETFGPGWPKGPLSTEEMVRMYSRSRVNLGFGGVAGHRDTYCLKGRDFEVPMSGGLYLTEESEELAQFYQVGKEIVSYSGPEDLIRKVRWLLANPADAEAIRQAGRRRALSDHTWEKRFEKVFRVIGLLE